MVSPRAYSTFSRVGAMRIWGNVLEGDVLSQKKGKDLCGGLIRCQF
jgi:hypothetical protein